MSEQQPQRRPNDEPQDAGAHLLHSVERQLERLLTDYQQLQEQNRQLKKRETQWKSERAQLLQTRNSIQAKVEAMIGRLKDLEQE